MDSELHYLTYDPDEIMTAMMAAYAEAGGSVLRPGDEKEMLLRGAQSIIAQAFAGIDNALRMATLRYAVGDYLDAYGEGRNCYRIQAAKAGAKIRILSAATGNSFTIPAGTSLTEDGVTLYATDEDAFINGLGSAVTVGITAAKEGARSNALSEGTEMQFLIAFDGVTRVVCSEAASGGQDREDDETYRERIRLYGLSTVTTGPSEQYERVAKEVSSDIIDAKAVHGNGLDVNIYLIFTDETEAAAKANIISAVLTACTPKSERPLSDKVAVIEAEALTYTLEVQYGGIDTVNLAVAVAEAVEKYQKWQDEVIGQVFNPDILKSYLYQAGCTQVTFAEGSSFNGGSIDRTPILSSQRCKGTITTEMIEEE